MTKNLTIRKLSEVTPGGAKSLGIGGGGLEGAGRLSRETVSWNPSLESPDAMINPVKRVADARARDMTHNDGNIAGAQNFQRDSIVGSQYRLNATPDIDVIPNADEGWAEEFQRVVEARFALLADSHSCWLDNSKVATFTGMIRMGVLGFFKTGEIISTVEWDKSAGRPYKTCFQMISSDRLSNPDGQLDTATRRRGIDYDQRGRPTTFWFQIADPGDTFAMAPNQWQWKAVPIEKPWGRRQVIHIIEQQAPDQSRGLADIVAVLKNTRMGKKFRELALQNAVVQASYAAAIESELPPDLIHAQMNGGSPNATGINQIIGSYMEALLAYVGGSNNIQLDGVKIPHLFPGTKLNLKPLGNPGGIGVDFENAILRHTAAGLGMSYEEFTRDLSQANYSSLQAGISQTRRFTDGRKKMVADRQASEMYACVLEEMIANGDVPLPRGARRDIFYKPLMKEAFCKCDWIGASEGQIDQLKETQAAVLRIDAGLSTYEREVARLGGDFRKTFAQRAREDKLIKKLGLSFTLSAKKPLGDSQQAGDGLSSDPAAGTSDSSGA